MTNDDRDTSAAGLLAHPVRAGLVRLLHEQGTVTATDAARALGYSSGLCSFHLRQLARHGHIEEVPGVRGRVRPWRLRAGAAPGADTDAFDRLARGLEDESYQRWVQRRDGQPPQWQCDEAFSAVLHLAPEEVAEVARAVRRVVARYTEREWRPALRPPGARPVAVVARVFPLLDGLSPSPGG